MWPEVGGGVGTGGEDGRRHRVCHSLQGEFCPQEAQISVREPWAWPREEAQVLQDQPGHTHSSPRQTPSSTGGKGASQGSKSWGTAGAGGGQRKEHQPSSVSSPELAWNSTEVARFTCQGSSHPAKTFQYLGARQQFSWGAAAQWLQLQPEPRLLPPMFFSRGVHLLPERKSCSPQ